MTTIVKIYNDGDFRVPDAIDIEYDSFLVTDQNADTFLSSLLVGSTPIQLRDLIELRFIYDSELTENGNYSLSVLYSDNYVEDIQQALTILSNFKDTNE